MKDMTLKNSTRRVLLIGLPAFLLVACGGSDGDDTPAAAPVPFTVTEATGSGITTLPTPTGPFFDITAYGAVAGGPALANQLAINTAITVASVAGGGTVVIPSGTFKTYSIRLKSNVGLHLQAADSILQAAIPGTGAGQDGGFYDAAENNLFVGTQDQGHSHKENSLIHGIKVDNVMISGPGTIDGGYLDGNGIAREVVTTLDPPEQTVRTETGVPGGANKVIALQSSTNIVFRDFRVRNGGHFAIIGNEVVNWTVDGVLIDTNRDGLNIDSSQNVTVRNSVFNSFANDAIVIKSSFAGGRNFPTKNVLIEKSTVSGYDEGSVIDKTFSTKKIVERFRDGPTGRIKLGTESTNGFDTITVRNMVFERSRGFALEAVDGGPLTNIIFSDSTMKDVASSPIFIRLGDRGRAPVTGNSATDEAVTASNNVRLDDLGWIMPAIPSKYGNHPAVRYVPSYSKNFPITVGGADGTFNIVNPDEPTRLNRFSDAPTDPLRANAVGAGIAKVKNIRISNITVKDADPRYPILIAGLVDNPVENVSISNVSVEYRGGLKLEHAVEQRQLNKSITYTAYQSAPITQVVPFLVNSIFASNEALLPRISWNPAANGGNGAWEDDPYNVPELPRNYPEPSMFGVLPAYGIYARHVKGLTIDQMELSYKVEDERPAVVLDGVDTASFSNFKAMIKAGTPVFVTVTNTKKREPVKEFVKNQPYKTTTVANLKTPSGMAVTEVTITRPAPGTPPDTLYSFPTAPSASFPYSYPIPNASYPFPTTVYPGY